MKNLPLFFLFIQISLSYAQVGIGTTSPNAALEIVSNNDGLLIPRMGLTAKNVATVLTPTLSEIVYNTAMSGTAPNDVVPGFYFWNGTAWNELSQSNNAWNITGNSATNPTTHFIGTTDDSDLVFKRNNTPAGRIAAEGVSLGFNALANDITNNNIGLGTAALGLNTTGFNNIAVGKNALNANIGNQMSIAIGNDALLYADNRTTGRETLNIALGHQALRGSGTAANNTGFSNHAIGYQALFSNTTGHNNSANGNGALFSNTTGTRNIAVGNSALYFNTTGSHNSAIGMFSLFRNTTGVRNIANGLQSLQNNTLGSDNIAIGAALHQNTTGSNNIAFGYHTLANTTTGSYNIAIGTGADIPFVNGSNQIRMGAGNITYAGIQVGWSITSDSRWKSDIQSTNLGLDFINKLQPVSYFRSNDESKKTEYGFIAQELEAALNTSNATNNGIITIGDDGMYSVRYNDLISISVKAIQEQQEIIDSQNIKIKSLEDRLKVIEEKLKK